MFGKQPYKQGIEPNLKIKFQVQDRRGKTSSAIPSAHVHHLQ